MSESTEACIRGCRMYRHHLADCEGAEDETCRGCLPRRAEMGHLCHTCHRRLELMVHDAPTVVRWLTGSMAGSGSSAAKEDYERSKSADADESPTPLRLDILDHRDLIRDRLTLWVDHWCEHKGLSGPDEHTPEKDASYLLTWLPGICGLEWIDDWWTEMAETMSEAHALAPWRPEVRRVKGVPCPGCTETNLVIYGGETDIACQSCNILMTEDKFALWERVLKAETEAEVS